MTIAKSVWQTGRHRENAEHMSKHRPCFVWSIKFIQPERDGEQVVGRQTSKRAQVELFIKLKVSCRRTQCCKSDIKRLPFTKWRPFKVTVLWPLKLDVWYLKRDFKFSVQLIQILCISKINNFTKCLTHLKKHNFWMLLCNQKWSF